jgi:uncharacterized protein YhjY with autotransporter beta-barrel domain
MKSQLTCICNGKIFENFPQNHCVREKNIISITAFYHTADSVLWKSGKLGYMGMKMWASMTQVSDVAHGLRVYFYYEKKNSESSKTILIKFIYSLSIYHLLTMCTLQYDWLKRHYSSSWNNNFPILSFPKFYHIVEYINFAKRRHFQIWKLASKAANIDIFWRLL